MAGTEFIGAELIRQIQGNYDRLIAQLAQEINDLSVLTVEERHAAWRASAEQAVVELAKRVTEATDAELAKFSVGSPPYPDEFKYRVRSLEDQIDRLFKAKDKAVSYANALAADSEGVVILHAADLRRIGYEV